MKSLLKYLGILIVVIGALVIVIPAFLNATNNTTLIVSTVLMIGGLIAHVLLNKYLAD
jgi:hypothetical protein